MKHNNRSPSPPKGETLSKRGATLHGKTHGQRRRYGFVSHPLEIFVLSEVLVGTQLGPPALVTLSPLVALSLSPALAVAAAGCLGGAGGLVVSEGSIHKLYQLG